MKLYAQAGFQLGDKVEVGLRERILDGAILSPKDMPPATAREKIAGLRAAFGKADLLLDPQFYASLHGESPNVSLGNLTKWQYFRGYRKSQLEITKSVRAVLKESLETSADLDLTGLVAPNIYIGQSLDSREAVIAKSFIRETKDVYSKLGDRRPVYASLAICREALQDRREFEEFVNDLTVLESPPDGIYLIVGGRASGVKSELFHADVLANWMLLNLSLSINGMQVINGYCDTLMTLLGVAGGAAGATGWFSNLRMFAMDRFFPSDGGRAPIARYLSTLLLNRIRFDEKEAIGRLLPSIVNGLPHDRDYDPQPDRTGEALQTWEAVRSLTKSIVAKDVRAGVKQLRRAIEGAKQAYAQIASIGLPLDPKSRDDHLIPLEEAVDQFVERAEIRL